MSSDMSIKHEGSRITRTAGTLAGLTLVSRLLGLVRDIVIAYLFGTGPAADAFFVAFRIPNVLRRLFAEGALTVSFVPVFTGYLHKKGKREGRKIFNITFTLLFLILLAVSFLGIYFSPFVVKVVAPGFSADQVRFDLAVLLNRVMFSFILLIGIAALAMGVLNSMGYFFSTGAAPVLLNLCMIGSALLLSPYFSRPVIGLSVGVILGGAAQFLVQLPYLWKEGFTPRPDMNLSHPAVKEVMVLMVPAAFGASVYQINILITQILCSFLPTGSVSWLWYADRFFELPLGLFAVSVATAVLPSLSRKAASRDSSGFAYVLSYSIRATLFICIPSMLGLILLREPLLGLVFERGAFGREDTIRTAQALLCYSLGLPAVAGARVFVQAYYAMKDTRTPVVVAIVSFIVNFIAGVLLMRGSLRHAGLALATSLSAYINLLLLVLIFSRRLRVIPFGEIFVSLVKTSIATVLMSGIVILIYRGTPGNVVVRLSMAISGGIASFIAAAYFLKSNELKTIWNTVLSKRT